MWNQATLAKTAGSVLGNRKFIVVSNREPYVHQHHEGKIVCTSPAGGLISALKPIISAVGGTWVAQGTGSADRHSSSARGRLSVPPESPSFTLRRLWIPAALQHAYYEGLSNQALWPLCHNVFERPVYRDADWNAYRRVNEIFAEAVLEEAAGEAAVVFVQDYHLALLPQMLKSRNPRLSVGHFWHIPWPGAALLETFPWAEQLISGLLGSDFIGFHLRSHCENFIESAELIPGACADRAGSAVRQRGHTTVVKDAPISIDFDQHNHMAQSSAVENLMHNWRARLGRVQHVGLGIDRCDYTKGIPERLAAIGRLLEQNPALREQLTFIQVAVPSRSTIPGYAELDQTVEAQAAAINERFKTAEWQPILLEKRSLPPVEMMALHRLAAFCMVTPLHDGMNLVAKEFVASRFDGDGVLILSKFAGASRELKTAVTVNPFSETSLCNAVANSLTMPAFERMRRMSEARRVVKANNIYRWAGTCMEEMAEVFAGSSRMFPSTTFDRVVASVV